MIMIGAGGALWVYYQRAARLGSWTLTAERKDCAQIDAVLVEVDDWWITHVPTRITLDTRRQTWSWMAPQRLSSGAWRVHGAPQITARKQAA